MAIETPCQTPDTVFHTSISGRRITLTVDLPDDIYIAEEEARTLEANLHNVAEICLSRFYVSRS